MNRRTVSFHVAALAFATLLMISGVQELYSDDLQLSQTCSITTLKGSYGFNRTGDTPDGPLAAVGRVTFDGVGNFAAGQIVSRNGDFQHSKFAGQNRIAADCTLKMFDEGGTQIGWGIIVEDGNSFFILNRSSGNTVSQVGRKIHTK